MSSVFPICQTTQLRKPFLLVVLQGWRKHTAEVLLQEHKAEVLRLQGLADKRTQSIWTMNKAELVETARKEIGLTIPAAHALTVLELRERLRNFRTVMKDMGDPLSRLPKGLARMKTDALLREMQQRNLPLPDKNTNAKMICMIRDDVRARWGETLDETDWTQVEAYTQMDLDV